MFNISSFFEKFKQSDIDRGAKINEVIKTIENQIHIVLKPEEICISQNGNIKINSNPVKRNEIFMSKEKIMTTLRSGGLFVRDLV